MVSFSSLNVFITATLTALNLTLITLTENWKFLLPMGFFFCLHTLWFFCWKLNIFGNLLLAVTLDTASSFHSLSACSLGYFSEVYVYHSTKTPVSFFWWHNPRQVYCHLGKTMVSAGLSLTVSFPDPSDKLAASLSITFSSEASLIAGWLQHPGAYTAQQSDPIKFGQR